jgi:ribosomal protein L11 methyltransferase
VEQLLLSLKDMGTTVDPWSWNTEVVDPQSWQEAYKQFFSVTHLGKRIVVKPSWEDYTPASREKIIELDPGMAFGTGLHASTQLVIHMMERLARSCPSPLSVLDMGCGTGILSIAAAQLWPNARIYAIDNDELAVQVCKENVQRNKLDGHIKIQLQSGAEVDATYDLVLANLTFETLTDLHPKMRNYASDFGRLILSGLLVEQAISLGRLYCRELIWEPEYTEAIGDWMAFLLRMR